MRVPHKNWIIAGGIAIAGLIAFKALSLPSGHGQPNQATISVADLKLDASEYRATNPNDEPGGLSAERSHSAGERHQSLDEFSPRRQPILPGDLAHRKVEPAASSAMNSLPLASTPVSSKTPLDSSAAEHAPVERLASSRPTPAPASEEVNDFLNELLEPNAEIPSADGWANTPTPAALNRIEQPASSSNTQPNLPETNQVSQPTRSSNAMGPSATEPAKANLPNPLGARALNDETRQSILRHLEYGRQLAGKGSVYSARDELLQGLTDLAKANDYASKTSRFSTSLNEALMALQESTDLIARGAESELNVAELVQSHQSRILSPAEANELLPIDVAQRYLFFAWNRLVDSAGGNPIASNVLYSLGKLHLTVSQQTNDESERYQSMCFFRACYALDPQHAESANELAVQLARSGDLDVAKSLLLSSLRHRQVPMAWKNLATIHELLGEHDMAARAQNEYAIMQQGLQQEMRWMPPEAFVAAPEGLQQQPAAPPAMAAGAPAYNQAPPQQPGFGWQTDNQTPAPQRTANQNSLIERIKRIF